jgi:hypothetical protein
MEKIDESINRETTGRIEQKSRTDPESRLPGQVDRMLPLEKFQEIIDTGGGDQQAAQAVRHRLKDLGFLNQENIRRKN